MRFRALKIEINDQQVRRESAQRNYQRGPVRYVMTRGAVIGAALFLVNLFLLLRNGTATAQNIAIVAVICAVGGIILGIGRWMYLLRVLRRQA